MTELVTPNNRPEMLGYCRQQRDHLNPPDKYGSDWHNDCQAFHHVAWGLLTGGFGSAKAQWLGLDPEDRHVTSDPDAAPVGASLYSEGDNPAGHVYIAAHAFKSGATGAFSTDILRFGQVDKCHRDAPMRAWGHRFLGWGTSVNGFALDLTGRKPPTPKANKRYLLIGRAITNLEGALETAVKQGDSADARLIRAEIQHQKKLYSELRHV